MLRSHFRTANGKPLDVAAVVVDGPPPAPQAPARANVAVRTLALQVSACALFLTANACAPVALALFGLARPLEPRGLAAGPVLQPYS